MNSTSNQTFYLGLEFWYNLLGLKPIYELLYVYVLTPFCLISFALNFLAFLILKKSIFKTGTFYLVSRLYLLNSSILSLILMTSFVSATYRIFEFTNSYGAIFFGCFIYNFLLSMFYTNVNFFEVLIVFERMLYFLPNKFKQIKTEYNKVSLFLFILSFAICLPDLFLFTPGRIPVEIEKDTYFNIFFWNPTEFSRTLTYTILGNLCHVLRDLVPLILKLVLNLISVKMMRNYFNRIRMEKLAFALKISSPELHENIKSPANADEGSVIMTKTDRNQVLIAIIMCLSSLIENFFYIASYVLLILNLYELAPLFYCISCIAIALKNTTNFFVLYKFNNLFRVEFRKSFRC